MRKILAIDPSTTSIGLAYFYGKELMESLTVKPEGKTVNERMEWVAINWGIRTCDCMVIELPWGITGRSAKTMAALNQMLGILKLFAWQSGCKVVEVFPQTWPKCCGIKRGTDKKQAAITFAKQMYNADVDSHDEADAICIGHWYVSKPLKR